MGAISVDMDGDGSRLDRELSKIVRQQRKMEAGFKNVHKEGKKAGKTVKKEFGPSALKNLKNYAGGIVSIGAALGLANQAYQTWLKNIRETAAEAGKAANELIALAALQEGGTKAQRVRSAADLGASFGILNRGETFNAVQALFSGVQKDRPDLSEENQFKLALERSKTVFAATLAGVPLALGLEAEIQGSVQGAEPGDFIRKLFVAGQKSQRTPELLTTGAQGLSFFEDKDFAIAASTVLAGSFPRELRTALKGVGIALSPVGKAQPFFEEHGLGEASREKRLDFLVNQGIDSLEELKKLGITEERINFLLPLTSKENLAGLNIVKEAIVQEATPGLFLQKRAGIEDELPQVKVQRQIDTLNAQFKNDQAFDEDKGLAAQREILLSAARGKVLQNRGIESVLGYDVIDEQGRTTPFEFGLAKALAPEFAGVKLEGDVERLLKAQEESNQQLLDVAKEQAELTKEQNILLKETATQRGNGPAFMGPFQDQGGPGEP